MDHNPPPKQREEPCYQQQFSGGFLDGPGNLDTTKNSLLLTPTQPPPKCADSRLNVTKRRFLGGRDCIARSFVARGELSTLSARSWASAFARVPVILDVARLHSVNLGTHGLRAAWWHWQQPGGQVLLPPMAPFLLLADCKATNASSQEQHLRMRSAFAVLENVSICKGAETPFSYCALLAASALSRFSLAQRA